MFHVRSVLFSTPPSSTTYRISNELGTLSFSSASSEALLYLYLHVDVLLKGGCGHISWHYCLRNIALRIFLFFVLYNDQPVHI